MNKKDLKIGDYIYIKMNIQDDDFKYVIGQIIEIKNDTIVTTARPSSKLPKAIDEFNMIFNETNIISGRLETSVNSIKLIFEKDIKKQETLDKMEVLLEEIDIALGFKNEKAFNNYVKEYKELEQELNKNEVMI